MIFFILMAQLPSWCKRHPYNLKWNGGSSGTSLQRAFNSPSNDTGIHKILPSRKQYKNRKNMSI